MRHGAPNARLLTNVKIHFALATWPVIDASRFIKRVDARRAFVRPARSWGSEVLRSNLIELRDDSIAGEHRAKFGSASRGASGDQHAWRRLMGYHVHPLATPVRCSAHYTYWGMFRIHVKTGHSHGRPERWTFSDGKPIPLHACKNTVLSHRLAEPFSDPCLCTSRGVWRVKSPVDQHASGGFSCT